MINKISDFIIKQTINFIAILLLLILIYSSLEFVYILFVSIVKHPLNIDPNNFNKNSLFLGIVLQLISAILLILIIVEILELVIHYKIVGKQRYLTLVIEIAIISLVRHLIALDVEHIDFYNSLGISILLSVLGAFYLILINYFKKNKSDAPEKDEVVN